MSDYSFAPVSGTPFERPSTTTQALYSHISRWKDPAMALFKYNHGAVRQDFDRSVDPIFAPIASELYLVPTQEEFNVKKDLYLKDLADRKTFANATIGQLFVSAVGDPTSLIPIVKFAQTAKLSSAVINASITGFGVSSAEEALRYSQMPNYDPIEGAFNIGANTLLNGFGSGALYGGKKLISDSLNNAHRRLGDHQQSILEMESFVERQEILREMVAVKRPLGQESEDVLRNQSIVMTNQISGKANVIESISNGSLNLSPTAGATIQRDIDDLIIQRGRIIDELNMRRLDEGLYTVDDPWSLATSFYDKLDILPTPIKTIGRFRLSSDASQGAKEALNRFKKHSLMLAGDSSLLFAGQKLGLTLPPSVHIKNNLRKSEIIQLEDGLNKLWKEATDAPKVAPNLVRRISGSAPTLDEWIDNINIKRMRQEKTLTDKELEAVTLINNFTNRFRDEAEAAGVIGSSNFVQSRILQKRTQIGYAEEKLADANEKQFIDQINYWQSQVTKFKDDLSELQNSLEYINSAPIRPMGPDEPYFMRQWDKNAIDKDEKGTRRFRQKLTNWVRQNPYGVEYDNSSGLFKQKDLTGDLEAQDRYVDNVIRSIITDIDPSDTVTSRSTKFPSRAISIPNTEVLDFINTNAREVFRTYTIRTGSKIDFAQQFGNRTYDELADELVGDLVTNGVSLKDANELRKNLTILYKRVTASTLSDPTSYTNKFVQFLKEFTSLNYLGGAGVTAIGDVPKMIMEHGFKDIYRSALSTFDSAAWQRQISEVKPIYAEALELSLGTTQQRILEDTGSKIGSKAWTQIKDMGFILNALGPMTVGLKSLSGSLSVHKFIDISKKIANGTASTYDREYALRYGLSIKQLKEVASAPTETTKQGLNVANIGDWYSSGISTETITSFRAAVSQNVQNTILSSTPATRFTYADGSIYLRIDNARKLMPNIPEDPEFPGYARWESGVMTLPFQFYNFSMSAASNILQTAAQGQIKSRYAGFSAMLGMGYMLAKLKTPDWAWDDMDYDERFMAAVERSGISSIYGDVAINSIRIGVQLGLNDPDNDIVQLPFYGKEGYAEAATTVLGAGSSTILDAAKISGEIGSGEYAKALKEFWFLLPLTELFWLKEDSRSMIDYASKSIFDKN